MELFLPSLLTIVLAAIVVFVLLPKLSPYIMGGLALAMLILGIYQHYSMFPYEYKGGSLQAALKDYAPFIVMGLLIIGLLTIVAWSFGVTPPAMNTAIPTIPGVNAPLPTVTGALAPAANNKGGVANALGLNRPANNKGVMNALGLNGKNNSTKFTTV
jgi:hypothetical protein